jgi:16S rRNA (uracil1498-N3)-methyltransferase
MPAPRLYIEHPFAAAALVPLEEGQARYLTSVMRLTDGAPVRVFNGADGEWDAVLTPIGRKGVALTLGAQTRAQTATPDLALYFAPVKRHGADLIVEKATELGVRLLQPVITRRTVAETVRIDRLRRIAIEAAEQTERLDIPDIAAPLPLSRALEGWETERPLIFCDEEGDAPSIAFALSSSVSAANGGGGSRSETEGAAGARPHPPAAPGTSAAGGGRKKLALLTGPEGGFDAEERRLLRSLPFVIPVSLGPRILRAETAVIAALAVIQSSWGDW